MKKIISTENAPAAIGPYSQGVNVGPFYYFSGQIPLDAKTGNLLKGSVTEQTQKVMSNIKAVLDSQELTFEHVIKTTIFLKSMDDFAAVNEIYGACFTSAPPARSTVEVSRLPKDVDVEIEVIAYK